MRCRLSHSFWIPQNGVAPRNGSTIQTYPDFSTCLLRCWSCAKKNVRRVISLHQFFADYDVVDVWGSVYLVKLYHCADHAVVCGNMLVFVDGNCAYGADVWGDFCVIVVASFWGRSMSSSTMPPTRSRR